ncbi:MAG: flagellar basal body P-ring formation chaperone FlgA [Elstera sp.]
MPRAPRFLLSLVGLALALLIAPIAAQAAAMLKSGIQASGILVLDKPDVRLGDLFDGLPADVATRPVRGLSAPEAGMVLDAERLEAIARENGLSWRPASPSFALRIDRPAEVIGEEMILQTVTQALAAQGHPTGEIRLDAPPAPFTVGRGQSRQGLRVSELTFDPKLSRFIAQVGPAAGGETRRVAGRVIAMADVPVMTRAVGTGEVIQAGDVSIQRLRADQAGRSYVVDPDRIIGKTARRTLLAGQPVRPGDLNSTMMVQKNAPITVNVVSGPMALAMQGKALDDGALGDMVRVLNIRSNKVLSGIVSAPGTVTVQGATVTLSPATPPGARTN